MGPDGKNPTNGFHNRRAHRGTVADPAASDPADILIALEILEQRLFIDSVKR